jgi:hypothetical protein
MIILKSIVIWLGFILAESLNGAVRMVWLIPVLGDPLAHQVSFGIGSVLIVAIATVLIPWLHVSHRSQLLTIGVLWSLLTVVFEILLGYFILDYSWQQIVVDYNLLKGGLMPIGLVLMMFSPFIATTIRGLSLENNNL